MIRSKLITLLAASVVASSGFGLCFSYFKKTVSNAERCNQTSGSTSNKHAYDPESYSTCGGVLFPSCWVCNTTPQTRVEKWTYYSTATCSGNPIATYTGIPSAIQVFFYWGNC